MLNGVRNQWKSPDGSLCLIQGDSAEVLSDFANEQFDCCVTDPPYGIDYDNAGGFSEQCGWRKFEKLGWDKEPPKRELFDEIRRVSGQQIIWGGNYFTDLLPPSMQWLVWDKGQRDFTLADCEFAWSSQDRGARIMTLPRATANREERFHPTQKPTALIAWCIEQIRPTPKTVIDPFAGSFTTAVVCHRMGLRCVCIEREPAYFEAGVKRVQDEISRAALFEPQAKITQRSMFEDQPNA